MLEQSGGAQLLEEGPELDAARSIVAMIEGTLPSGTPTQGAGIVFAVSDGWTYIATAYHVVRPGEQLARNLRVRLFHQPTESLDAHHYADARSEHDLAVIRVRAAPKLKLDQLSDPSGWKKSQPAYAIGYPLGEERWDTIYAPAPIGHVGAWRLKIQSPSIKKGYSGGAVIDTGRMLVGMVLDTDGATAEALRIDRLADILKELGLPVGLSRGKGGLGRLGLPFTRKSDRANVTGGAPNL